MKEYKLIQARDVKLFEVVINELCEKGWMPTGQMIIIPREKIKGTKNDGSELPLYSYFQMMVKKDEPLLR